MKSVIYKIIITIILLNQELDHPVGSALHYLTQPDHMLFWRPLLPQIIIFFTFRSLLICIFFLIRCLCCSHSVTQSLRTLSQFLSHISYHSIEIRHERQCVRVYTKSYKFTHGFVFRLRAYRTTRSAEQVKFK